VGEEFDAIVLIRIVRGGNDDTDVKIVPTNEASDTGSSENSGERNGSAPFEQTSGDNGRDVRAGFARVSTDQCVRRTVIAVKVFGDGKAKREESGIIERRSAGDTTNTVRTEKLSRHRVTGRRAPADKKV